MYFSERDRGTVNKVPKQGGPVMTLVEGLHDPYMIVVDRGTVYFIDGVRDSREQYRLKSEGDGQDRPTL